MTHERCVAVSAGRASGAPVPHLRLVHSRRPRLSVQHLALFETPRTWAEILKLEPRMRICDWREGVADADEYGLGLLAWSPAVHADRRRRGTWQLTDEGRTHVARMTRSR